MQLYAYFEDLFKVATGDVKIDLQRVVNTGSGINDKRLIQLLMDIDDIKKRVVELEKSSNPTITMFLVCKKHFKHLRKVVLSCRTESPTDP